MRTLLLLPLSLFILGHASAQDNAQPYLEQVKKAETLQAAKSYKEAGLTYSDAFKMLGNKGRPEDRYNAARAWAMAGSGQRLHLPGAHRATREDTRS